MKFPKLNLDIFKRSPSSSNPTTNQQIKTNSEKRKQSHHAKSHRRTSRKRSITYYSPSKSKFYPFEHFPTIQRRSSAASINGTAAYDSNINKFLNQNRTFSCADQETERWIPNHQLRIKQNNPQFYSASELCARIDASNKYNMCATARDYNANRIAVDDLENVPNHFDHSYMTKCSGAPTACLRTKGNLNVNPKCEPSPQHQLTASRTPNSNNDIAIAYNTAANINSLCHGALQYPNSEKNTVLFQHSSLPIIKKHARHRHRKVCVMENNVFHVHVTISAIFSSHFIIHLICDYTPAGKVT